MWDLEVLCYGYWEVVRPKMGCWKPSFRKNGEKNGVILSLPISYAINFPYTSLSAGMLAIRQVPNPIPTCGFG